MGRHISDHDKLRKDESRAAQYMRIEMEAEPNPSAKALHRRRGALNPVRRLREYLRIERREKG